MCLCSHACCGCASVNCHLQASKPPAAADEHLQELTSLRERVQQMTNRMGQMEQKVSTVRAQEHIMWHTHTQLAAAVSPASPP